MDFRTLLAGLGIALISALLPEAIKGMPRWLSLVGIAVGAAIVASTILLPQGTTLDFVSTLVIGFSVLAIAGGGYFLFAPIKSPTVAKPHADRDRRRLALIAACRELIIRHDGSGEDPKTYLPRHAAFASIRKYLSPGYLKMLDESGHRLNVSGGRVQHSLIKNLSAEIDRIETEWGLDLDR